MSCALTPFGSRLGLLSLCAHCQRENREGARFCVGCGQPLARSCPACGASLDPGSRFCAECGSPVGSPESAAVPAAAKPLQDEQRRHLTVLFSDLVESTRLASELDPEDMRELVQAYQRACSEAITSRLGLRRPVPGRRRCSRTSDTPRLTRTMRASRFPPASPSSTPSRELRASFRLPDLEVARRCPLRRGRRRRHDAGERGPADARHRNRGDAVHRRAAAGGSETGVGGHQRPHARARRGLLPARERRRADAEGRRTPGHRLPCPGRDPRKDTARRGRGARADAARSARRRARRAPRRNGTRSARARPASCCSAGSRESESHVSPTSSVRAPSRAGNSTLRLRCSPYNARSALFPFVEHLLKIVAAGRSRTRRAGSIGSRRIWSSSGWTSMRTLPCSQSCSRSRPTPGTRRPRTRPSGASSERSRPSSLARRTGRGEAVDRGRRGHPVGRSDDARAPQPLLRCGPGSGSPASADAQSGLRRSLAGSATCQPHGAGAAGPRRDPLDHQRADRRARPAPGARGADRPTKRRHPALRRGGHTGGTRVRLRRGAVGMLVAVASCPSGSCPRPSGNRSWRGSTGSGKLRSSRGSSR